MKPSRGMQLTMAASTACWCLSLGAYSQQSDPEISEILEEVVVTAQRREQNIMKVAMAVTAVSGERLNEFGALDLSFLSNISPNTTVEVARGTNNSIAAYIRGVGQQDHIAGFESGVGVYVDDVYFNRPQMALLDIIDVERIEVLRGPQGTLYGRNTIGGAIKYVTRPLGEEPELKLRGRVGDYGMRDLIVGGSTPLGHSVHLGATFASLNLDGFGENIYLEDEKNYQKRLESARTSLEWEPNDAWFIRLAADWIQDDSDLQRGHRTRPGRYSGATVLDNPFNSRAGNTIPEADASSVGWSASSRWTWNEALELRFILAARRDETWKPVDLDGLPTVDVDVSTWDANRQKTAEFQALFDHGRGTVVAGLFAIDARAATVLGALLQTTGELIGQPGLGNELSADIETQSWAVYADADWTFTDQWSASLGARFTHDRRNASISRRVMFGGVSPFFGGSAQTLANTSDFESMETFQKVTPRAALQWWPVPGQQLYLGYSEGFKGGGFDPRGLSSLAPDANADGLVSDAEIHEFMLFDPEEVSSWEFGWKYRLFDGRANSRLALFRAEYTDVQIPGATAVDENGDGVADTWVGVTTNAASARLRGLEWEGQALIAENLGKLGDRLELNWALGYIKAKFNRWINSVGDDVAASSRFANTPKWTTSVAASYIMPLTWLGRNDELAVTALMSHRDDEIQFERPIDEFDQGAYTLWDIDITWAPAGDRWQIGLHGKNLTDERYIVGGLDITLGLEDNYTVYFGKPRQFWLDFQILFR